MRWKPRPKPKLLASRIVRRFLFLPTKCSIGGYGGEQEWRWLEWAYIEQIHGRERWQNCYWVERPETGML